MKQVAAQKLKEAYELVERELLPALMNAKEVDKALLRIQQNKPFHLALSNNDGCNLPLCEHSARGATHYLSLMTELKLPNFNSVGLAWPPPQPNWAVDTVAGMRFPPGPSENWHEDIAARNAQRAEDAKRMAKFYADQAQEREAREKAEGQAERAARQVAR